MLRSVMRVALLGLVSSCGPMEDEGATLEGQADEPAVAEDADTVEQAAEAITCIRIVSKSWGPEERGDLVANVWTVRLRNDCNGSRRYKLDIALRSDTSCRSIGFREVQTVKYDGASYQTPRRARDC